MRMQVRDMKRVQCGHEPVEIFEIEERQQVERDPGHEPAVPPARAFLSGCDCQSDQIVREDGTEEQNDIGGIPCCVKDDRHQPQPCNDGTASVSAQEMKAHQCDGKKFKKKSERIK